MTSFLRYSLPFLPDPYVTNFELVPDAAIEKNGIGYLNFAQSWSEESTSEMDIDLMTKIATPARTMQRNKDGSIDDNELGLIYHGEHKYWEPAFSQKELESGVMPDVGLGSFFHIPNGNPLSNQIFHPPTLMDISTNLSQFGVTFGTGLSKEISPGTGGIPTRGTPDRHSSLPGLAGTFADVEDFRISGMMLQSAQSNVRIMTLPGTHWEGVLDDSSHATYQFPYSGPTTHIAIQDGDGLVPSVKLVPIAPQEAIDDLVDSFASRDNVSVAARHSLPFGMVALATMRNDPTFPPARVHKIEFKLGGEVDQKSKIKSPELEPAHQLSFTPPGKPLIQSPRPPFEILGPSASSDRSFSGMTTILKMGLGPNAQELIDPATDTFLSDMQNKVPLSRFDVSGYGASMFSDWKRVLGPQDVNDNAITNVLINVFNGRTSRTVVELQSVMAPFAVDVVKTIEIRRLNSGIVLRHESEWQPSSDGYYFYKNNGIITHPGIIRGVTNVRNITDISRISVDGVHLDLRKVQFDCDVQVEDGGHGRSVTGLRLDGCVLLTGRREDAPDNDLSSPNAPAWYASILQHLKLGGYIDAVVQIGTSGQMKRLTSISVKPSLDPASSKPVAVVAAMGSPIFVGGGQWSFVRTQSYDSYKQPYPVDLEIGVPLVKLGSHDSPDLGSILTPYVFKDPQDLLTSHRVIFTSPQIPFVQDAKKGFEAAEVWVADSFALGKSATIFPNIQDCLPVVLPDLPSGARQLLEIDHRGGYKFEPTRMLGNIEISQLEFPAPTRLSDLERTIKNDASVQTVAQIMQKGNTLKDGAQELSQDVLDARTTISVAINTFGNVSKMDITNLHMVTRNINTATGVVKDATRVIGRLSSDVQKIGGLLGADPDIHLPDLPELPKVAGDVQHVFGSSLSQVQKAISFLDNLKFLPHFKVSMTNEWSMVMSTSMNKNDLLEKLESPGPRDVVEKIIEQFDFLISATLSLSAFLLKMHIGTTIKIPTGVGPIVALGTGAFDVALGTSGVEVKLDLGFGIGVDFSVGPFSASASYTQSQTILFNDQVFGLGITACMRAHVDLVIASADLYLEAKLLVVGGDCHPPETHAVHGGTTIWAYASVKIALHVSIFLVCNIGVEEDAHWDSNLNGGGCLLDNMSDLIH
ncbi:hypothetical protein BKA61DRAFT_623278 [Leptodontidium sp. MPI-SDFR-AT-0119]|nr:hypothetical protein BKA61DRAFT_623278 [Leptodontidium sp. MPI-SDFR-AT-0119]